jgi:hypothetical protein
LIAFAHTAIVNQQKEIFMSAAAPIANPNTTAITLTDAEANELLSAQGGNPGQQQVQQLLREQLADGNRTIHLTDPQLGKLVRFTTSGPVAVQQVLKRVFQRPLVELISKR